MLIWLIFAVLTAAVMVGLLAPFYSRHSGQPGVGTPWRNPDSHHYGMVVPGRVYQNGGYNCRDYTHTVYIDGRPETMRGRACRNGDGSWRKA